MAQPCAAHPLRCHELRYPQRCPGRVSSYHRWERHSLAQIQAAAGTPGTFLPRLPHPHPQPDEKPLYNKAANGSGQHKSFERAVLGELGSSSSGAFSKPAPEVGKESSDAGICKRRRGDSAGQSSAATRTPQPAVPHRSSARLHPSSRCPCCHPQRTPLLPPATAGRAPLRRDGGSAHPQGGSGARCPATGTREGPVPCRGRRVLCGAGPGPHGCAHTACGTRATHTPGQWRAEQSPHRAAPPHMGHVQPRHTSLRACSSVTASPLPLQDARPGKAGRGQHRCRQRCARG